MKRALFSVVATTLVAPFSGAVLAQEDGGEGYVLEEVMVDGTSSLTEPNVGNAVDLPYRKHNWSSTLSDVSMVHNLIPGAVSFGNKAPIQQAVQIRGNGYRSVERI